MDDEAEQALKRLNDTDGGLLVRAADGMDTAYEHFRTARGRVAGIRADTVDSWDSGSGRAMRDHLETVDDALSEVGAALSIMQEKVRAHGRLADQARELVRTTVVETYQSGPSMESLSANAEMERKLHDFLDSEKALTEALWSYGALAPGGIPLPAPPPRPPGDWKTFLFGDGYPAGWYWVDAHGEPAGPGDSFLGDDFEPGTYDPARPIYAYDEWGRLVPAYQAGMPVPMELQEAGIGSGLLKLLGKVARGAGASASGARAIGTSSDELAGLVRGSYGWRPGHIDRHIREWYRLADDAEVPTWMKDEYLARIVAAGTRQGKVFQWSVRGEAGAQPTYSVLRYERDAGRWLVSQYYASGSRAGEFATAFEPSARQLARMLQQSAIR